MQSHHVDFTFPEDFPFHLFYVTTKQTYLHSHDCLEIDLILEGKGLYIIENKSFSIDTGDIFIINNSERHTAIHQTPMKMLVMIFPPDFIWQESHKVDFLQPFFQRSRRFSNKVSFRNSHYEEFRQLIMRIDDEYQAMKEGWQLFVKSLILLLLAEVYRYYQEQDGLADARESNYMQLYERIKPAIDYIHRNYFDKITLDMLAKKTSMNRTYFSTYFSQAMNIRVFEYIDQVRINQSMRLLKTTDKTVTEIAGDVGFSNVSYFNRVFKKMVKKTPTDYRKKTVR